MQNIKEIVLATSNQGKIRELKALLPGWQFIAQSEFNIEVAQETGLSFIENAIIKARHASNFANKPALAEDSGLVVEALHGAPGIYSARFAGENATDTENMDLLLKRLEGIAESERQAYYYCAMVLVREAKDPTPIIATGKWIGTIAKKPRGNKGFGYDPIFYLTAEQCTAAQLSPEIKNTLSHRAMALNHLQNQI